MGRYADRICEFAVAVAWCGWALIVLALAGGVMGVVWYLARAYLL